jgi:hypothetical protein
MIIPIFGDSEVDHTIDNIIDGDLNWYVFFILEILLFLTVHMIFLINAIKSHYSLQIIVPKPQNSSKEMLKSLLNFKFVREGRPNLTWFMLFIVPLFLFMLCVSRHIMITSHHQNPDLLSFYPTEPHHRPPDHHHHPHGSSIVVNQGHLIVLPTILVDLRDGQKV